jgi:hypothetical protein
MNNKMNELQLNGLALEFIDLAQARGPSRAMQSRRFLSLLER